VSTNSESTHSNGHNTAPTAGSAPSRIFRTALFTLVPIACLSVRFWRPLLTYHYGGDDTGVFCPVLMGAVLLVSLLSWHRHRVVAALGLLVGFLWFVVWIQPAI